MLAFLKKIALCGACVFVFFSVNAVAATERWERHHVMSTPEGSAETVAASWQGGSWAYSDMSGYFKFLYTQNSASSSAESVAQRVYLQWLRTDGVEEELIYSIALKEVSSVPAFSFVEPVCVVDELGACSAFKLGATHVFEESNVAFIVKPGGLGQYRLWSAQ